MAIQSRSNRAGMNPKRLERLNRGLEAYVERGEVTGYTSLLYRKGEIAHLDIHGSRDPEAALPVERDTIFRIFSMTKPILAVTALSLVEEARLRLDDPLNNWLPELADRKVLVDPNGPLNGSVYPAPRAITLRDLLTYRMGIGWGITPGVPYEQAAIEQTPSPIHALWSKQEMPGNFAHHTPDEWMKNLATLPLRYAPGERWLYNVPSDILGVLISRVTGKTLAETFRERIFEPLGMKDTGFWVPPEKLGRFAVGYGTSFKNNGITVVDHPGTTVYNKPPLFESGAGGLVSTVDDYLRFGQMLLNRGELDGERIISRKAIEAMTTDYLTPEQHNHSFLGIADYWRSIGFGFGVAVVTGVSRVGPGVGSYSWGGALGTYWVNDPREEMISILMIQRANPLSRMREDFLTLAYQAIED